MFFSKLKFLTESDDFAKSTAFAGWPILKLVLFYEYLVFSGAVFLH